jgi:hypothetical protein
MKLTLQFKVDLTVSPVVVLHSMRHTPTLSPGKIVLRSRNPGDPSPFIGYLVLVTEVPLTSITRRARRGRHRRDNWGAVFEREYIPREYA